MMKSKKVEHLKKQLEKLATELNNTGILLNNLGFDNTFSEGLSKKEKLLLDTVQKTSKVLIKKK